LIAELGRAARRAFRQGIPRWLVAGVVRFEVVPALHIKTSRSAAFAVCEGAKTARELAPRDIG